ncbi:hypothetical protein ACFP81_09930 [Deinococcus lacus]|uniref:Uncharacterized protein n=1 Tax=Deinococcus lacus TaxID=392561 RepID=A0ABW1YDD8_9DEIO
MTYFFLLLLLLVGQYRLTVMVAGVTVLLGLWWVARWQARRAPAASVLRPERAITLGSSLGATAQAKVD